MKKSGLIRVGLALGGLVLASCAGQPSTRGGGGISMVFITDQKAISLLAPGEIEESIDLYKQLSGHFGVKDFLLEAYLLADPSQVSIFLYSTFGMEIAEFFYDGQKAVLTSKYVPKRALPEYMIADLQFVFYKPQALREEMEKAGLRFEQFFDSSGESRVILDGSERIISIQKTGKDIRYENHLRGYGYTLRGDG